MARINIEDSIFKDIRFIDLIGRTGGLETALGTLVRAWSLAQTWYLNEESNRLIPIAEWDRQRLTAALFDVGLAEVRDGFVYVSGSDEQFQWLIQKQAAGRTPKSKRVKAGASARKRDQAGPSGPKPLPLPLSPSLPLPLSQISVSSSAQGDTTGVAALSPVNPSPTALVWSAYSEAYRERYGQAPTSNAKVRTQIANFVKRVPASEASDIVRFYVSSPKVFYVQNLHDFGLCLNDAEKLRTQWLNGGHVTDSMVQEYRKKAILTRAKGIAEILADKENQQANLSIQEAKNDVG